jgi:lysyl-tRNA synthetase class 2
MSENAFPLLTPLHTVEFDSSAIARVTYEYGLETLHVEFRDGRIHQYSTVPVGAYQDLLGATSKGAHFNRYIRSFYPQRRSTGPPKLG